MGDFYTQLRDTQHGNKELGLLKTGWDQQVHLNTSPGGRPLRVTLCPLESHTESKQRQRSWLRRVLLRLDMTASQFKKKNLHLHCKGPLLFSSAPQTNVSYFQWQTSYTKKDLKKTKCLENKFRCKSGLSEKHNLDSVYIGLNVFCYKAKRGQERILWSDQRERRPR